MIELTVAQIAEIVGGAVADISPQDAAHRRVTGTVEFDSRAIGPGGLFLALPGARADGHDHAASAVAAGAAVVLAARPVGVPAIVVPPVAAPNVLAGVLEHDNDGSGRRCWPRWPSWPPRWPRSWWPAGSPSSGSPARRARRRPRT